MKRLFALSFVFAAACQSDETVAAFTLFDEFTLLSIDGAAVQKGTTLNVSQTGRIHGQAPCNRYSAEQRAPYPWVQIGPIISTRMACPNLQDETAFFDGLRAMTIVEVVGDTLILSNDAGGEMVFRALDDGSHQ